MQKKVYYSVFTILVVALFCALFWIGQFKLFDDFLQKVERNSFDIRQTLISKYKTANKDIIILAVDDETYEYMMDKYGSWPISRQVWADVINGLNKVKAKYIVFDLLFIKRNLNDVKADENLIQAIKNHDNVYLAMNFDNYSDEVRKSQELDDKFKLDIDIENTKINDAVQFKNSRLLMKEILDLTSNIGIVNIARDKDGIVRGVPPIYQYKGNFYPNLSLKVAMKELNIDKLKLKDNTLVLDDNHKLYLDSSTSKAILSWYGPSRTFTHISFWHVLKALKEKNYKILQEIFENKIVYIGTTVSSLSDIKSVPTDTNLAGVELITTFLNNILDNDTIKKTSATYDFVFSIILCFVFGYFILKIQSVAKTFVCLGLFLTLYCAFATYVMYQFNIWVSIVLPCASLIMTFILVYVEKYLLKVEDYEQTYKLAVTDGLTQLYNHRYFQETMLNQIENYVRHEHLFSLILIDIDFFKKFNDTYGHQSGDCVLRQVAMILKKNSRTTDVVCRYGGEEMSIILPNTNNIDATVVANKVCSAVRENKFILANGEKVNVTISVGVATVGQNGVASQAMIEYADKCLYKAKENGRNQVVVDV